MFDTSSYHYKSRRPGQAVLEHRIKEICQTRVRYGYRRVHVLLRREGWNLGSPGVRVSGLGHDGGLDAGAEQVDLRLCPLSGR